jgi:hypothetical protein
MLRKTSSVAGDIAPGAQGGAQHSPTATCSCAFYREFRRGQNGRAQRLFLRLLAGERLMLERNLVGGYYVGELDFSRKQAYLNERESMPRAVERQGHELTH